MYIPEHLINADFSTSISILIEILFVQIYFEAGKILHDIDIFP